MCEFCKKYKELQIMETTINQKCVVEKRKIKSGLVLSVMTIIPEFESLQNLLRGVFELNFCPECGKKIKENKND